MRAVYSTDRGKIRDHNEDSVGVFYGEKQLLAVVADGMGGHAAGDVASQMAIKMVEKTWNSVTGTFGKEEAVAWMNALVPMINKHLFDYSESHEECKGMGTTIAAALCQKSFVVVSYIGDSRVYLWQKDKSFRQVTEDHTLVNELVKSGQLTKEAAEYHPKKHILLRALGTEPTIEVDTQTLEWTEGAQILICSDGLTNKISDEEIHSILESDRPLEEKTEQMIQKANDAGGEDNISITIVVCADGEGV